MAARPEAPERHLAPGRPVINLGLRRDGPTQEDIDDALADRPRRRRGDNGPSTNRVLAWAAGLVAAVVVASITGISGRVFDALFAPRTQVNVTSPGAAPEDSEWRRSVDAHIAATNAILRQREVEAESEQRFRESTARQLGSMNAKLDLLLAQRGLRPTAQAAYAPGGVAGRP